MKLTARARKMDVYDTLTQLNFILKIFTLHNVHRETVLRPTQWPFLKLGFMLFFFGLMYFYNMYFHFFIEALLEVNLSVKITESLSSTFGYVQYIIDLYFVYKYGSETCVAYYEIYYDIDQVFEMKYHREIKKKVFFSIIAFLSLWFLTSVSDYTAWFLSFGWESPTMFIVAYFTFLIRMLTVMELNAHSMHVGYRLKTIADVLKGHFSLVEDVPSCIRIVKKLEADVEMKIDPVKTGDDSRITRLGSYYLLLSQQAAFLNNFFGVRILLHCLFTLSQMITTVNLMARVFAGSMYTTYNTGYFPAVTSFMRLFTCAVVLTSMVYRCEQSSRQCGHVASALDHALVNKRMSKEVRASLKQLRSLVTTRPIRFHAANFFNLDSTLLLSTASVMVTYAVILLQTMP